MLKERTYNSKKILSKRYFLKKLTKKISKSFSILKKNNLFHNAII